MGNIVVENCQFYEGVRHEVAHGATVRIGNGTYLNRNTVVIADSDLHPLGGTVVKNAPVTIEDNVWIGCRVIVLKGVRIGRGTVIAAGAVITRDVPPNTIAGGVPARVIAETPSHRNDGSN